MVSMGGEGAFPPGSKVQFVTSLNHTIEGQVVCFDPALKVLAIRDQSASGRAGKPVVRMFNMSWISEIRQISPPAEGDHCFNCNLSNQQISERCAIAESRRQSELMDVDIPLDGQKVFIHLRHVLDDVHWKGADIVILNQVLVKSPYTADSAESINDSEQAKTALAQVKKILLKPIVERKAAPATQLIYAPALLDSVRSTTTA